MMKTTITTILILSLGQYAIGQNNKINPFSTALIKDTTYQSPSKATQIIDTAQNLPKKQAESKVNKNYSSARLPEGTYINAVDGTDVRILPKVKSSIRSSYFSK